MPMHAQLAKMVSLKVEMVLQALSTYAQLALLMDVSDVLLIRLNAQRLRKDIN